MIAARVIADWAALLRVQAVLWDPEGHVVPQATFR
jgi:hypothetical protein